jgi:Tfp pilus assembly protein PilF
MNTHLQRALMLLEQSRYEIAETELRKVFAEDPNDATAHALLAMCLAEREKRSEAQREAELAIHLAPEESFVFYAHSVVLREANRFSEAQAAIEEALELDPYEPDYFAQLSQLHFDQRHWREALLAAEEGLELDPEDVTCTNLRAMALVRTGEKVGAEEALKTALKRDPEDAYSHANMGWSLIEQGRHEKAMEHFREALRLNPNLEWARAGIIEAMKARYFIYRAMLNWFLWMMKLSRRAQWGVILGGYFGFLFLRRVAIAHPNLSPWIIPLLVTYIAFVVMTWTASPLFNLVLRLNRFGRLALSKEQTRTSNWVGLCVFGALGFVATYFATGVFDFLACALAVGLLIPVFANIYNCSPGWPRATIVLSTIALGSLAFAVIANTIAGYFVAGPLSAILRVIGNATFIVFVIGAVAAQFGVNALVSIRPRRKSTLAAWLIGGSVLSLVSVLYLALAGLMIFAVWYEEFAGPELFNMPIRTKVIARDDLMWDHANEVQQAAEELQQQGFLPLGDYVYEGLEGVRVRYLIHEDEAIVAELVEHPEAGFYVALATVYTDGRVFSYYNGDPQPIQLPPNHTRKRLTAPASELLERIRHERAPELVRTVTADEVVTLAEELYASEMDHLLRRGGPSTSEFQAIARKLGVKLSDDRLARLQALWRKQASSKVDDFVVNRFLDENERFREARNRILCVHDLLTPERLARVCAAHQKKLDGLGTLSELAEKETPREAFSRMASRIGNLQKIGETEVPIATDIYLIRE